MAQEVVGSNPTTHPILPIQRTMGCRQAVRHQTLTLALVGSNPATPASFDPLAQLVEHLTFNQVVRSSTLRRITIFSSADADLCAGVAELADAPDLGSGARKAYGFKSLRPHQNMRPIPAGVAHLVERSLAKAEVAGSSPVSRSIHKRTALARL